MKKFIFLNRHPEDSSLELVGGDEGYKNLGPVGGMTIRGSELAIPLVPEPTILSASPYKTDTIALTGEYMVEVDGKVIPWIFKPEDLSKFFDGKNPDANGLVFQTQPANLIP